MNQPGQFKPSLIGAIDARIDKAIYAVNCVQVGTIQSFNPSKCTATVKLGMKAVSYAPNPNTPGVQEVFTDYKPITDCPVVIYGGGGAFISMPIAAGDPCLILFNDRDISAWQTQGVGLPPFSDRCHHMSDAICLVGLVKSLTGYSSSDIIIKGKGLAEVLVGAQVAIRSGTGVSLVTALDLLLNALIAWVDTNKDTPNPATILALKAAKTAIDQVLKS
jgi:hypothetical protein